MGKLKAHSPINKIYVSYRFQSRMEANVFSVATVQRTVQGLHDEISYVVYIFIRSMVSKIEHTEHVCWLYIYIKTNQPLTHEMKSERSSKSGEAT